MQRRNQIRRPQTPEDLDHDRRDERPPQAVGGARVLALQRSAGNHSLSARLARAPDDPPMPASSERTGAEVTLPDIGTVEVSSVQFGPSGASGPTAGGGSGKIEIRDMTFSSTVGDHSPKLAKANVDGKPMAVTIVMPTGSSTMVIKLTGAIVSNYTAASSSSGESAKESWSLNFEKLEQSLGPSP